MCYQVTSLGYKELVTFHSFDKRGKSVYHTNVMMAIGTDVAVVCAESVTDDKERQNLLVRPCMISGRPRRLPADRMPSALVALHHPLMFIP